MGAGCVTRAGESLEQLTGSLSPDTSGSWQPAAACRSGAQSTSGAQWQLSASHSDLAAAQSPCELLITVNPHTAPTSSAICPTLPSFLSLPLGIHAVIIFQRHLPTHLEIGLVLYVESKVRSMELMFSGQVEYHNIWHCQMHYVQLAELCAMLCAFDFIYLLSDVS